MPKRVSMSKPSATETCQRSGSRQRSGAPLHPAAQALREVVLTWPTTDPPSSSCSPPWRAATTCRTSPRSRSPTSSASVGSRSPGCWTRHVSAAWSASRSSARGRSTWMRRPGCRSATASPTRWWSTRQTPTPTWCGNSSARPPRTSLSEVLVEGDVLGLPWSRNVHAVVGSAHLPAPGRGGPADGRARGVGASTAAPSTSSVERPGSAAAVHGSSTRPSSWTPRPAPTSCVASRRSRRVWRGPPS